MPVISKEKTFPVTNNIKTNEKYYLGADFKIFCIYLLFIFLNPHEYIPLIGSLRPALLISCLSLFFCISSGRGVGIFQFSQTKILMMVFLLASISTIFSINLDISIEHWGFFLRAFFLYALFLMVIIDEFKLKLVIRVMFIFMAIDVGVSLIMQKLGGIGYRLMSFDGEGGANDYALMILSMIPFGLYLFEHSPKKSKVKYFYGISILAFIMAVTRTRSRMGFVGLLCLLSQIFWYKRKNPAIILMVFALTGIAFFNTHYGYFERVQGIFEEKQKENPRIELWKQAGTLIKEFPILGVGPGNFIYAKNELDLPGNKTHVPHNAFLQVAAENGIPAFAFYFLLSLVSLKNIFSAEKILMKYNQLELLSIAQAIRMSYIVLLLSMVFLSQQYNQFYFIFAALSARIYFFSKNHVKNA